MKSIQQLIDTVIKNDYCIGCGACAALDNSPFEMKLDENGKFRPYLTHDVNGTYDERIQYVCPFSDKSKNETTLGKELFERYQAEFNEYTGYYLKNFAGYVIEGEFRDKGSSGGMGNWIASQLLKLKLVDGVIHVKEVNNNSSSNLLFKYQISRNLDDLMAGAKSKYYPIELSEVIQFVKKNEGRYAMIGVPCFIKSVRLLAANDENLNKRIKYCIGLVCGHLKSDMFAKSMGWQLGIHPNDLRWIDFRKKLPGKAANDYGVEVVGKMNGKKVKLSAPRKELYTTNWGQGLFKYNACEYCDDVLSETADVTVGDAWLPEYRSDSEGTNIVVVRNPEILKIIEAGIVENKVYLKELTPQKIYQSQAGGFRHRRDGLSYRIYLKDKKKEWRPKKRVAPSDKLDPVRKEIYRKRLELTRESFKAFKLAQRNNSFNTFIELMDKRISEYENIIHPNLLKRIYNKIIREVTKLTV